MTDDHNIVIFDSERPNDSLCGNTALTGTPIALHEIEYAIKSLKDRKTLGQDECPAEVPKLINTDSMVLCLKYRVVINNLIEKYQATQNIILRTFNEKRKNSNLYKE